MRNLVTEQIGKYDFDLVDDQKMGQYLSDSTPFLVALTKKGNLSVLVTSTSPPLLSMAPWWMAALQILDC